MTPERPLTREELQALITRAPFHRWLGLAVTAVEAGGITVSATWREEFVVNPDARYTHGGILATLIDVVADYALAAKLGRPFPTADLQVDYHRAAMPGDLVVHGRIIRQGRTVSTAEARVLDRQGALLASGRGLYMTGGAT